jgi:uncharacterized repeat protein (TIGR04042 family)
MPALHFQVRWPDDEMAWYYSPSTSIREHFEPGARYPMNEFVARARAAMHHAAERVRSKYGFYCSSAMDTLATIETKAATFDAPDALEVQVLDFSASG